MRSSSNPELTALHVDVNRAEDHAVYLEGSFLISDELELEDCSGRHRV